MWIKENCGYIANSEESAGTKWFYYNCKEGTKVLRGLAGYVPKRCSPMKQSNQCSVKYTKELPSRKDAHGKQCGEFRSLCSQFQRCHKTRPGIPVYIQEKSGSILKIWIFWVVIETGTGLFMVLAPTSYNPKSLIVKFPVVQEVHQLFYWQQSVYCCCICLICRLFRYW